MAVALGDRAGIEGRGKSVDELTEGPHKHHEIAVKATPGPEAKGDNAGSLLDRPITRETDRPLRARDPRQIELALAEPGLANSKPKSAPGAEVSFEQREGARPLPPEAAGAGRSVAARIGCISHDLFDVLCASKERLRATQGPTGVGLRQLE